MLRGAALVTERRDANRILYSLAPDRLALSVGDFLSNVCPEQIVLRVVREKKSKAKTSASKKSGGSQKRAAPAPTAKAARA
ncbi:hypothetical protein [Subtercola sp. RTI3]|uniref:hypothetical protein n=1 Tax=Subtercola sp. RTI3 TaxID=3048639 RepID=UPI002B23D098|nr:hypothetical protein [Subtercola sp. RTI3]MEA9985990.1 hypothetical protein [Subtercola sp. RTI3]